MATGTPKAYLGAIYAIATALRDAVSIDDAAPTLAGAIARAASSGYAALHLGNGPVVRIGERTGARVALPLVTSSSTVGTVVVARHAALEPELAPLLAHVATEIEAHERRQRESRLTAAREERWRALLSVLTQVVWVADASGAFVVPQPSWQAFTGQPWEAHRGIGWVDALHPDDRPRARRGWARAIASADVWQASGRIWHARTGAWRSFVARATPLFDNEGRVREWVGTLTDVHDIERAERERAELLERAQRERARMYQLFDRAPALIAIQRGREHVLEFVNAAMQRVIGAGDAVGRPLSSVFPFEHYIALSDQVLETGKRVIGTELPLRRDWDGDGTKQDRWFNFVHEPMLDDGRVEGVMSFGFDVTDLVTARRRVEAAVRELESTSRAKDEFLATVSHELRTPLGSILGWASLLGERFDDPDAVAKGADVIHRSARAQARIIDDILDVSRIITGKLRIDARPVGLEGVVKSALEVVRPSASAKNMDIDVVLPDEPCTVVGDEERLRQVVWNLLSNAIKFTERGGRVAVRLVRTAAAVTIEVSDTGRGIAPEFLPHVFERFRQADSSTTRAQGGLGLGLAIVRHLVELHGGHVEVRSEGLGKGATFSATLPIRAVVPKTESAPPPAPLAVAAPRSAPSSSVDALEGARVLVVDDELDAREMLGMALTAWGIEVRTAESASDAMRVVHEDMPDVVISDIGMPGEDGYAFVRRLRDLCRQRGEHVTAVALTAYARREDAARAIAAGFDFHVAKPIELDDLRVVVERALQRA